MDYDNDSHLAVVVNIVIIVVVIIIIIDIINKVRFVILL